MQPKVQIIKDSINHNSIRVTTFELEYHRFVHSEMMTHRMFSRNSSSSRAIPVDKVINQVLDNPALPLYYGKNKSGMQAQEELSEQDIQECINIWNSACASALQHSDHLASKGLHKQLTNRITEPFQTIKVVLTGTEFNNFFYLRRDSGAQPEIRALANAMYEVYETNLENGLVHRLYSGEWHLPYLHTDRDLKGELLYFDSDGKIINNIQDALDISVSCCAQVSYRKLDESLGKAKDIVDKLINSQPVHSSPSEHQAKCISTRQFNFDPSTWEKGLTHLDRDYNIWSGNLKDWIQYRQLIPNNYILG